MSADLSLVPLGRLAELRREKAPARKDPGLPYVGLEQIVEGESRLLGRLPSSASTSTNGVFAAGDILFGKLRPNLRKSVMVDFPGYCSTDILVLRPRSDVHPRYAAHVLRSEQVFDAAAATATGTKMPRTSWSELSGLTVRLPRYEDQASIARVLDQVDEAIWHAHVCVSKLNMLRSGLISDLLRRGVLPDGTPRPIGSSDFVELELGCVPSSWEVVQLRAVASVHGGKRLPAGHNYSSMQTGFRYLRVLDFFERDVDFDRLVHLKPDTFRILQRYEIHEGDVYISIAGSLGYAGVLTPTTSDRVVLTENAARIVPRRQITAAFLALQLNGPAAQAQIRVEGGIGSGVPKLALFRIERLVVVVPPVDEQARIVERVGMIDSQLQVRQAYVQKLKLIRTGVAEDLLTRCVASSRAARVPSS
jgi:type I restriction enzyme S subunit